MTPQFEARIVIAFGVAAALVLLSFAWRLGWFGDVAWLGRLLGPEGANAATQPRSIPTTFR